MCCCGRSCGGAQHGKALDNAAGRLGFARYGTAVYCGVQAHGPVRGAATGVVYSVVAMIMDGVIYHPLSVLLDYVLAFGVIGIAGLFEANTKGIIEGTVLGVAGRFLSSFLSGWLLFAAYAPEGQSPFVYSLVYQATYLVPELILNILVLMLIYKKTNGIFERKL